MSTMLNLIWNVRALNFLAFVATAIAMLVAIFYFQGYLGLAPCPLCVFQRIGMMGAGAFFLVAAIHNPGKTGLRVYNGLGFLFTLFGGAIAARHIWIQSLPEDKVPACGPDLAYMLDAFPFTQMVTTVLQGSGECAEVQWSFIGLTIPGWVLVTFVLMGVYQLLQMWKGDFTARQQWASK